ncbi:uncharacterized protein [Watersipora subatra]|uniref:uncharacterized protein n=1 Tax=Watersipora subatra TaxID=2589382 RepID=UPI00355C4147
MPARYPKPPYFRFRGGSRICCGLKAFTKDFKPKVCAPAPPHHTPPVRPSDDEDSFQDERADTTVPSNDQERYKADAAIAPSVSFLQTSHNNAQEQTQEKKGTDHKMDQDGSTSCHKDNDQDDCEESFSKLAGSPMIPSSLSLRHLLPKIQRAPRPRRVHLKTRRHAPPHHTPLERLPNDQDRYQDKPSDSTVPSNDQERYKANAAIAPSMSSTYFLPTHYNNGDNIDEPQGQQSVSHSSLCDSSKEVSIGHPTNNNHPAAPALVPPEEPRGRMAEVQGSEHSNVDETLSLSVLTTLKVDNKMNNFKKDQRD